MQQIFNAYIYIYVYSMLVYYQLVIILDIYIKKIDAQ